MDLPPKWSYGQPDSGSCQPFRDLQILDIATLGLTLYLVALTLNQIRRIYSVACSLAQA